MTWAYTVPLGPLRQQGVLAVSHWEQTLAEVPPPPVEVAAGIDAASRRPSSVDEEDEEEKKNSEEEEEGTVEVVEVVLLREEEGAMTSAGDVEGGTLLNRWTNPLPMPPPPYIFSSSIALAVLTAEDLFFFNKNINIAEMVCGRLPNARKGKL